MSCVLHLILLQIGQRYFLFILFFLLGCFISAFASTHQWGLLVLPVSSFYSSNTLRLTAANQSIAFGLGRWETHGVWDGSGRGRTGEWEYRCFHFFPIL